MKRMISVLAILVTILVTLGSTGCDNTTSARLGQSQSSTPSVSTTIPLSPTTMPAASASSSTPEAPAPTSTPAGMNIDQIKAGNFSSVIGQWTNDVTIVTVTQNTITFNTNDFMPSSRTETSFATIDSSFTIHSNNGKFDGVHLTLSPPDNGNGGLGLSGKTALGMNGVEYFPILLGFYPAGAQYPNQLYDNGVLEGIPPFQKDQILFASTASRPSTENLFHRK
ncbi:MAG: DUF6287 domain-containing protein [Candidatus Nanoperiomorbaceae bacterium]